MCINIGEWFNENASTTNGLIPFFIWIYNSCSQKESEEKHFYVKNITQNFYTYFTVLLYT